MDEQEEEIKKAQVVQSLGPTLLTQHIAKASVGSGPGESVFDSGRHGPEQPPPSSAAAADSIMHGPEPAPPSRSRSILNYFKPSKAPPSSTASASASASASVPAAALPPPSSQEVELLAQKAANFAQASNPAKFKLYDSDEDDFYSDIDDDGGLGADVADALEHYQQLEAERLADSAHQVHDHLEAVSQQGLPLAHVRAQGERNKRSYSPTRTAGSPVPEVVRAVSHPTRRRLRSKSSAHKATYTETPGASSSGVEPRGRSTDPKIIRDFKL